MSFSDDYYTNIVAAPGPYDSWELSGYIVGRDFPSQVFVGPSARTECVHLAIRVMVTNSTPDELRALKAQSRTGQTLLGMAPINVIT